MYVVYRLLTYTSVCYKGYSYSSIALLVHYVGQCCVCWPGWGEIHRALYSWWPGPEFCQSQTRLCYNIVTSSRSLQSLYRYLWEDIAIYRRIYVRNKYQKHIIILKSNYMTPIMGWLLTCNSVHIVINLANAASLTPIMGWLLTPIMGWLLTCSSVHRVVHLANAAPLTPIMGWFTNTYYGLVTYM